MLEAIMREIKLMMNWKEFKTDKRSTKMGEN